MSTEELPPFGRTLCTVTTPHGAADPTGHAVMFAPGGEFAGRTYRYGERIILCLRHADQVIDWRRTRTATTGLAAQALGWLACYPKHALPLPILPEHNGAITPRTGWTGPAKPRRNTR